MSTTSDSNENGKRERSDDESSDLRAKALRTEESNSDTPTADEAFIDSKKDEDDSDPKEGEEESDRKDEQAVENPSQLDSIKVSNEASPEDNKSKINAEGSVAAKSQANDPRKASSSTVAPSGTQPAQDVSSAPVDPNKIVEEKGEVSALYVGRVIGKGGEMIRDLQARSGAQIDVDQNVPPGHPRVITYRGTQQTVDFAKKLVAILSREGATEHDLPLGNASCEQVVIPSQTVGKIIGRGGEMIRELQSRSQAKIQIDHTGRSGHPPEQKLVTITGNKDAVAKASELVKFLVGNPMMDAQQAINMLAEDKARTGLPWGTGPPYPNLPNNGTNMTPNMTQFVSNSGPSYPYGGGYNRTPSIPNYPAARPAPTMPMQQSTMHQNFGQGGREVDMFYAGKQYMGRIIGGKGVTVNDLQRRSGCEIQINQDVPPGQDCEITLKGTRQAIESAKQMLKVIIETGPQHPYAGGADSYGGGAPSGYQQQQQQQQQMPVGIPQAMPQVYDHNYNQPAYTQPVPYMQPVFGQPTVPAPYGGFVGAPQQFVGYQDQTPSHPQGFMQQSQIPPQQPKAPPPIQLIPSPWKTATAPDGQFYYYNERTGETTWVKPAGLP